MKKLLFLLLPLFFVVGCFEDDPCDFTICYNDGYCEDGSCICPLGFTGDDCGFQVTPSLIVLKSIRVTDFPATDDGYAWDSGSNPDIYPVIYKNDEILFEASKHFPDANVNEVFNFDLTFDITNPFDSYAIALFDYDSVGQNDYMAGIEFTPYHDTNGFPTEIELNAGGLSLVLVVEYVF